MNLFNNKQTFNMVVTAIQASQSEVQYNKTWRRLHLELGIGSILNNMLNLTASDRQHLSRLIENETGLDPIATNLSDLSDLTRTEISKHVVNEKWSKLKIRKEIIYLKSLDNEVKLDKNYLVPEKGYIAVPWQQAANHKHQKILAIENLEVFLNAEDVNWPKDLFTLNSNPLILYRGDTEATPSAFKKFIEATQQDLYAFFDYDPAGLMMALTQPRLPSLIIPDAPIETLKKCSKKMAYDDQFRAIKYLKNTTTSFQYQSQINFISIHQLAVMQEKILSFKMRLKLITH